MGIKSLLCARNHAKHLTDDMTFDPQTNLVVNKLSILPIKKKERNRGWEQ